MVIPNRRHGERFFDIQSFSLQCWFGDREKERGFVEHRFGMFIRIMRNTETSGRTCCNIVILLDTCFGYGSRTDGMLALWCKWFAVLFNMTFRKTTQTADFSTCHVVFALVSCFHIGPIGVLIIVCHTSSCIVIVGVIVACFFCLRFILVGV